HHGRHLRHLMAHWVRVLAQQQGPTLLTGRRRDLDQPINFLLRLQFTPVPGWPGWPPVRCPEGRQAGRDRVGGSDEGGLEELREVCLSCSSNRAKRCSTARAHARTLGGVAAQSSTLIPVGGASWDGIRNSLLVAYHQMPPLPILRNTTC